MRVQVSQNPEPMFLITVPFGLTQERPTVFTILMQRVTQLSTFRSVWTDLHFISIQVNAGMLTCYHPCEDQSEDREGSSEISLPLEI